MNKKTYIIITVIAAVVVAGVIFFIFSNSGTPSSQTSSVTAPTTTPTTPPAAQNPPAVAPTPTPSIQYVVTYTDSGFSPSTLTVPKGATVIFKNSASDDMRVASNPHPVHSGYPTKGGCVSSTFDSCSNISPGASWSSNSILSEHGDSIII